VPFSHYDEERFARISRNLLQGVEGSEFDEPGW